LKLKYHCSEQPYASQTSCLGIGDPQQQQQQRLYDIKAK